ncbi:hypothetical protein A0J61_02565 [Choanephora cucurbitarum]|uniref:Uncharacterized protein n=1 Tax=Choanephora cucurbitarum TaxID=101091 RepID=A0A1C7NJT3_9FUNG|nr:hypothetical protein A0J61_02565 [Choanephora cucurbitarum]
MSDNKKATFWNPRPNSDIKKPSDRMTFCRPRTHDFSDAAWDRKYEIWYQQEPAIEFKYSKSQDKKKGDNK